MKKSLLILYLLAFSITTNAQYTLTLANVTFSNGEITDYTNTTEKDIIIQLIIEGVFINGQTVMETLIAVVTLFLI